MQSSGTRKTTQSLYVTIAIVVGLLAALAAVFFWGNAFSLYRPAPLLDINADIHFLQGYSSLSSFLFGYHNEHVVATTRALTLLDYVFFGSQYRTHQAASIALLLLLTASLAWLIFAGFSTHHKAVRATLAFFVAGVLLAPVMVAVVAFPYFVQHFIAGFLGLCFSVVAWQLYRRAWAWHWRIALLAAAALLCFGLLATSGHGIVLVVAALVAPVAFSAPLNRRRAMALAVLGVGVMVAWKLWFAAAAGGIVGKLLTPSQWAETVDYYIRVLSLPAQFASGGLRLSIVFGTVVFAASVVCLVLAWRARRQDGSLVTSVAASLLIGHQLSVVLVAVGRAGTGWEAEDPKYAFYTAVIVACAAILLVKHLHKSKALVGAGAAMAAVLAIMLGSETYVLKDSRQFYRTIEVLGFSLALDLDDPARTQMLGEDPQIWKLTDFVREQRLNVHMRQPGKLLGRALDPAAMASAKTCPGEVAATQAIPSRDAGAGIKLEGWSLDASSHHHRNLSILVAQGGHIVGYGTFAAMRPDIVHVHPGTPVAPDALVGWTAYARPVNSNEPLQVYALDLKTRAVCRTASSSFPNLAPEALAANMQFLANWTAKAPLSSKQRRAYLMDRQTNDRAGR